MLMYGQDHTPLELAEEATGLSTAAAVDAVARVTCVKVLKR